MSFEKIKKNFGFGCMRLKLVDEQVDHPEFCRMIDLFMEAGFNYFDTAHGYINGQSETAIRDCLVARYDREAYVLANKLSRWYFEKEEDIIPLFETQLKQCGVEYFDFYLFHALSEKAYAKYKACNCFNIVQELKQQGKIKHIAMSFHDTAEVLDMILTEQPCIEAVQLQFNYLDFDDPNVQSKACYDVAVKHGKKVLVMEPVKGGALVDLPEEASQVLDGLGGSYASYALRFAASFPEVFMVLSGMGSVEMMEDNLNTFRDFVPLNEEEMAATAQVRQIIRQVHQLPCTSCRYCTEVCPQEIPIPGLFAALNAKRQEQPWEAVAGSSPADCIKCGKCEEICPQNLKIRELLTVAAEEL